MRGTYDILQDRFVSFLLLHTAGCRCCFTRILGRPSILLELVKLLSMSRSLSYKVKRIENILLRHETRCVWNLVRFELKRFQQC